MLEQMKSVSNTLTIIALFAALAEIAGTVAIKLVAPEMQSTFCRSVFARKHVERITMKKIILASVLVSIIWTPATAQNETKLENVKKIYIGDLGKEEGADLVREKIRLRLMKSERFTVVETPEAADAILTGVAGVERRNYSSISTDPSTGNVSGSGGTSYAGLGILRLVDVKSQETLWVFEYKRGFSFGSASSRVANKTVEQLLKDAKASDKKDESSKKQKEAKSADKKDEQSQKQK